MRSVIFAMCLIFSTAAFGSTLEMNPKRLIEVIGMMGKNVIENAQQIDQLTRKSKEPIYILLNSPGGSVAFGSSLIDSIHMAQGRGVKVVCAVGVLAASVAFNTLLECDERYSLERSNLLFHPIATEGHVTAEEAEFLAEELKSFDEAIISRIVEVLGMHEPVVRRHYRHETMWEARDLIAVCHHDWLTVVDVINGSDNVFVYERKVFNIFGGQGEPATNPLLKSRGQ